ncbi:MAG: PepSY domain-containing protein [Alphaproteobacteria bacterium]|nr:PepSY domain-containing protein [Alphaproteobacteria bacterium]
MLRGLHSWLGLAAALLVSFMAITGAVLSLQPAFDFAASSASSDGTVAELAAGVAAHFTDPLQIIRSANGTVTVYATADDGQQLAMMVDAASGTPLAPQVSTPVFAFFKELHRSLFLGQAGRAVAGLAAVALAVLAAFGFVLLLRRLGGWRRLFAPAHGRLSQRLHVELSRLSVILLLVTASSGVYLTLVQFGFLPDGSDTGFIAYPASSAGTPATISELPALQDVPVSSLRQLDFPVKDDPADVFALTTNSGSGFVDRVSGALLDFTPNSLAQNIYETIYMLHTGQGAWWFALLLGIASLGAPVLGLTGLLIWWRRRRNLPRIAGNVARQKADTIILVGSENNSSWAFARTLHAALTAKGHAVHAAAMNSLETDYRSAERMFILASTHGDGDAPRSADRFFERLDRYTSVPQFRYAVLGFGDKSFTGFCAYAEQVDEALAARGWRRLQPLARIDRQSTQAFAQWGRTTGMRLRTELALEHAPERRQTRRLVLVGRKDYGTEVQAPTCVLRFAAAETHGRTYGQRLLARHRLPRFSPGDLVGILPPGSSIPRYYSIASHSRAGALEICVRLHPGGECSEFLHGLTPGNKVEAFVERRPDFHPGHGTAPLVMIGAGTGIAPFAGFIRSNSRHRPLHLYWGGRDPRSDFLYGELLVDCLTDKRLTRLVTSFSRPMSGAYIQDRMREEAPRLLALARSGARFMVCGGREMGAAVRLALSEILTPHGLDLETLKSRKRYVEDVY